MNRYDLAPRVRSRIDAAFPDALLLHHLLCRWRDGLDIDLLPEVARALADVDPLDQGRACPAEVEAGEDYLRHRVQAVAGQCGYCANAPCLCGRAAERVRRACPLLGLLAGWPPASQQEEAWRDAAAYVHDHYRMRDASLPQWEDLAAGERCRLVRGVQEGAYRGGFGDLVVMWAGRVSLAPARVPEEVVQAGRLIKSRGGMVRPMADRFGQMKLYVTGARDLPALEALVQHLGVTVERDLT